MSVRVRFAPSPTGHLHIGNARAALINWLFAKRHGGEFILRQDDTDLKRSKEEYAQSIKSDLSWLGLDHDLFFKQSDRFDRYNEVKSILIKMGRLYPCFENIEELEFKRKRLLAKGKPPIYDRAALSLTQDEIDTHINNGNMPHWRFKLNDAIIMWQDLIRGKVSFKASDISDPVLIREDGQFLYTLTSVVDDFDYKITHIIRGEDHVTNTAVQTQLFEALNDGKPFPVEFAHTTLLMGEDGQPLSKRLGSLSLHSFKEDGIESMAINSLLARLGTSLPVEPHYNIQDIIESFNLGTFSRTPPRLNVQDLKVLSHKIYHKMPFPIVQKRLKEFGVTKITQEMWELLHDNIEKMDDLIHWERVFFEDEVLCTDQDVSYLNIALSLLPKEPWDDDTWGAWTTMIKEKTGKKGKDLFMPLRKAITGLPHGPEMKRIIVKIGYNRICTRLNSIGTI